MPGSGNKGDRGPTGGGGMGGSSNAGAGRGGAEGGSSRNNVSGGMSPASHKGDTVSGGGHSAYGPRMGYAGYSNVTGQERMARIGDRLAAASMSGFANGTSSGAAPTGIGGGFGPGQGPSGARAAQIGRDAFAAAQRAAVAGGLGFGSPSVSATRVAPRRPTVIARPPVTVTTVAPPPAPTITQLQSMYAAPALTSPNIAMNPSVVGIMTNTQVPGYSAPAPSAPAPNPGTFGVMVGSQVPGTAKTQARAPGATVSAPAGSTPNTSNQSMNGFNTGDAKTFGGSEVVGRVTGSERALMGSRASHSGQIGSTSSASPDRAPAAPGLPGSAGDIGVMGVPGGISARGTNSTNRGAPARAGVSSAPSMGGYADAGSRFGANTGLVGGYRGSGALGDPGVMGVQGGLAARGTTQAQALAKSAMDSSWGQASPTMAANLMARAVKGQLGPAATSALAAAQSAGFSPGSMMAAVAAMSPTANLNFTKGWQAQNMDPRVQAKMNELAKILGISDFSIVSGYRSPSYNSKVRGAKKSQHMKGTAVDVAYPANVKTEEDRQAFARALRQAGFTGIGIYGGWTHADLGPERGWGDTASRDAFAKGLAGGK
jgi:uncharacterized protein YcbK (DUF882 family)